MCNKDEDMKGYFNQHHCPDCDRVFGELLDLVAHLMDDHKK